MADISGVIRGFSWEDLGDIDAGCSGLPVTGETVCEFDEGFIAGIFHEFTGREFAVREVDCWASGDRVCRFVVKPSGNADGA